MDGDTTAKINGGGWSFVKWAVYSLVSVSILTTLFWLLFYSAYFANLSFIIQLRNWYQNTYWKVKSLAFSPVRAYPPFDPIYTISVDKSDVAGVYRYSLWGKVSSVDLGNKAIYILGSDGNEYAFSLSSYGLSFSGPAGADFGQEGMDIFKGAKVLASWQDARSLNSIKKAYEQNRTAPVNRGAVGGNLILQMFSN